MTPDRGDLIWINFHPQKGHEQAGRRPALVISPISYNALSSCILVCPINSSLASWPWKVVLPQQGEIKGAVLVDQIKSIDAMARDFKSSGQRVSETLMADILARLATLTQ